MLCVSLWRNASMSSIAVISFKKARGGKKGIAQNTAPSTRSVTNGNAAPLAGMTAGAWLFTGRTVRLRWWRGGLLQ